MADQQIGSRIVQIDGVGNVAFPDSMSDADVNTASAKLYADANKPPEQSGVSKAWTAANKPIVSGESLLNFLGAPTRAADYISSKVTGQPRNIKPDESLSDAINRSANSGPDPDHPILNAVKVGLAGATKDAYDQAASFTSPLSLLLMGAGAVAKAPQALGKAGVAVSKPLANVISGASKAAKVVQGVSGAGFGAQGVANAVEGVADANKDGATPNALQKILSGAGQGAFGAAGTLDAAAGSSPKLASSLNNSVLGTSKGSVQFNKDPGLEVARQGIVANTKTGLRDAIQGKISDLESQKTSALNASPIQHDVLSSISDPLNSAIDKATQGGDKQLVNKLNEVRDRITGKFVNSLSDAKTGDPIGEPVRIGDRDFNLSASDVNDLKKEVGKLTDWRQHGIQFKGPLNQVKTSIYGNLDSLLDNTVPDYQNINNSQSSLIGAKKDVNNQILLDKKRGSAPTRGDVLTAGGVALGNMLMNPQAPAKALLAGAGAELAKKAISTPFFLTRAARGLAQPSESRLAFLGPAAAAGTKRKK